MLKIAKKHSLLFYYKKSLRAINEKYNTRTKANRLYYFLDTKLHLTNKYKKFNTYVDTIYHEWELDGKYDSKSTLFTYLFRTYIGPFWLLVIIFSSTILTLIYQNVVHYYEVRELILTSTLSQVELSREISRLNFNNSIFTLGLYFIFFMSACFSVRTMTHWIFKSADLVNDNLKFTCETFDRSSKIKCVFSRLNFMIGAIIDNKKLIDEYQQSLLRKNTILDDKERKYRDVIDTSPDAILVMDKDLNFVESNKTADRMLGFNIVGENLLSTNTLISKSFGICMLKEAMSQKNREFDCVLYRKNTLPIDVHVRLKNLTHSSDTMTLAILSDITEKKASLKMIESSLEQKELLLKEIHHRVKNNMQIVSSMIGMQAINSNNSEVQSILQSSQNRIMAMMLIHEKLYKTSDITMIDFKSYIEDLVRGIYSSNSAQNRMISYTISSDDIRLDTDTSSYCGLIVNELVINAFKYAFIGLDRGHLSISLRMLINEEILLTISDNGKGFKDDYDRDFNLTLGLRLVKKLTIYQLKGSLKHTTSKEGTAFYIKFPAK